MICQKCKKKMPEGAKYCPWCGKSQTPAKKYRKRANGTGTVYKRTDKPRRTPWRATKGKIIIGDYATRKEALEALEMLAGQDITERYNLTFAQVYERWSTEHFPRLSKWGVQSYTGAYNAFSALHAEKFRSLRASDYQRVMDDIPGKPEAKRKYKQLLSQMSQWAMREEIIPTNYAHFLELPPPQKKPKEIFTSSEIARLTEDGSETAQVILMLIYTGMRIGELLSLPLTGYHEDYVVGGSKTEAGRNRVIPIRPEGKSYFARFAAASSGPLLLSGSSIPRDPGNFRNRNYYPLLAKLGIPKKSPHCTRHTYATWAVEAGVPPEALQQILGHASYSTTVDVYTHLSPEQLVLAVTPPLLPPKNSS